MQTLHPFLLQPYFLGNKTVSTIVIKLRKGRALVRSFFLTKALLIIYSF